MRQCAGWDRWAETLTGTEIFETTPPSKKPSAFSAGKRGKNTRAKSHFDPVRKWCRQHAVTFIVTLPVGLSRGLA